MLKRFQLYFAHLLTIALLVASAFAQQPRNAYREFEQVLSDELKTTNTPGAAVGIVRGDRIVHSKQQRH